LNRVALSSTLGELGVPDVPSRLDELDRLDALDATDATDVLAFLPGSPRASGLRAGSSPRLVTPVMAAVASATRLVAIAASNGHPSPFDPVFKHPG
jgi:hypothetical protein